MAGKNLDVGVKYTGDAESYEKAAADARKATAQLAKEQKAKSLEMERSFKNVTMAIAKVGGAAIVAQQAFKLFDAAMRTTGEGADTMTRFTDQLTAAVQSLGRSISTGDLDNLAANIRNAMRAAGEKADMEDINDQRTLDLSLRKSSLEARIKELRVLKQEGTIKKEQAVELKTLSEDLYNTEIAIFESRIAARIKFAANSKGLEASVFSDLREGVIARSGLNEEETIKLAKFTDEYKAKVDELSKQFTVFKTVSTPMGAVQTMQRDTKGYTKALGDYILSLSQLERVQVFEDMFSSETEWKALIGYMNDVNNAMTQNMANISLINRSSKGAVSGAAGPAVRVPETGISGNFAPAQIPSLSQIGALNEVMTRSMETMYDYSELSMRMEGVFANMFRAGMEGWDAFGEAAKNTLRTIAAEIAAKAAMFILLSFLPGGPAIGGLGKFLLNSFGFGQKSFQFGPSSVASGGGQLSAVLKGRDISLAEMRYNNTLSKNT
jgi:hypothetical protein